MKVIIAGSRTLTGISLVSNAVQKAAFNISEVVCGDAKGVDKAGAEWASVRGIPVKYFPPNYKEYGKNAPHVRNSEMAKYADALIAIWDGKSRGTRSMIEKMRRLDRFVYVHEVRGD